MLADSPILFHKSQSPAILQKLREAPMARLPRSRIPAVLAAEPELPKDLLEAAQRITSNGQHGKVRDPRQGLPNPPVSIQDGIRVASEDATLQSTLEHVPELSDLVMVRKNVVVAKEEVTEVHLDVWVRVEASPQGIRAATVHASDYQVQGKEAPMRQLTDLDELRTWDWHSSGPQHRAHPPRQDHTGDVLRTADLRRTSGNVNARSAAEVEHQIAVVGHGRPASQASRGWVTVPRAREVRGTQPQLPEAAAEIPARLQMLLRLVELILERLVGPDVGRSELPS
mmetsp:Transcript_143504/g.458887  ORF Transcript_143504/g.458887 Transcript_143504/m.458887 type:complete len:284 (+) Transcript_143504:380-1231(+)